MATLRFIPSSTSLSSISPATHHSHHHRPPSQCFPSMASFPNWQRLNLDVGFQKQQQRKSQNRGSRVITFAGPSTTTYIFAFVFPMSLIAVTVFTSIKIADELDRKFLEEVALNQEIMESEEGGTEPVPLDLEKPEVPRKRNRPKREVEASSR
ncbi:OLC1v1001257C1 [Oldenlandia corymbosa var. corymbosa]|uniref:OLC1v1001257C1 n=1 Tax=Oldenlandia corymbosa var. corymbosa TaxID=529605 RepID=A0AAV1D566_OLDCO|nr:OLC1v1001257C1 [Oldenlandia corymbosa var. corymbosa]